MNYRVKNISQPHGADASGAVIFSDNFTPPVKKSIITGEAEGKVILVGDALAAPPEELHIFGETLQKKTTGAQLFDVSKIEDTWNGEYGIKNNRDGSIYLMVPSDTDACDTRKKLKELCPELLADSVCVINAMTTGESRYIYLRGSGRVIGYGEKTTITNDDLESTVVFFASGINTEATISNIIVAIGETAKPWEPYTGGKPSPSPEYPQEIVSAGSVMTTGANLWDAEKAKKVESWIGTTYRHFDIQLKPNTTYTLFVSENNMYKDYNLEYNGKYAFYMGESENAAFPNSLFGNCNVVKNEVPTQKTFTTTENPFYFNLFATNKFSEESLSIVFDELLKNIMLVEGSSVLSYEPYTGGKPAVNPEAGQIEVNVYGGNLANFPDVESYISNGVTWSCKDGMITANGTVSGGNSSCTASEIFFEPPIVAGNYYISGSANGINVYARVIDADRVPSYYQNKNFVLDGTETEVKLYAQVNGEGTTVNNVTVYPMLNVGRLGKPYEPYKQPQTITFPTPGGLPGIPVSSDGTYTDSDGQQWLSDSIEYKNEKLMYVQRVETLRLLTDVGSIDSQNGYLNINNFLNADITRRSGSLCTHLTYDDTRGDNVFWIDSSGTGVRIKISKYTTSEEYLSWLAENEVYLTYPCANPIEKEISDPNLINQLKSLRLNSPNTTIVNDANALQKLKYLKETFTMANVNFRFGTYEQYKAVASKDTNTLYFVDGIIYKGDAPYSQKVEMVSAFPETTNAAQGVLYVNSSTYEAKFFNGTDFTTVFVGTVGNMDDAGNDNKVVTQAAVKAYVTKQLADADIPTDGAIDEKINAAKEEAITEAVSQAGTAADEKDAALKTQLEQTMDTKIAAQVASVFRFKGSKANKGEIDAIEGMVTGDVWHSEDDGKEYVYDGEDWELLGFTVDLSAYATTAAVTEAINAKATELTTAIGQAKDEAVNTAKSYTDTQLGAHTGNAEIHITKEERVAWNAKADTSYVDSAKQAAITAAASDATTKANQALTDAKAYTDQKNSAMDTRMKAVEAAVTWGEIA